MYSTSVNSLFKWGHHPAARRFCSDTIEQRTKVDILIQNSNPQNNYYFVSQGMLDDS